MSESEERELRRSVRLRSLEIRRYALDGEPSEDLSASTTPAQRIGMMWTLARRAWTLMGKDLPVYPREEIPGRLIRGPRSP